ncbi:MAG: hypothetical protein ACFFDD_13875 [Promethearchaeota archaeon]
MTQTEGESRFLPLIHCARGVLIIPIPVVIYFQYIQAYWVINHGPDIAVAGPFSAIGFGISVAVLEFYYAVQLYEKRVDPLFRPFIIMILATLFELTLALPPRIVENLALSIHISSVVGLSIIEIGLIAFHS